MNKKERHETDPAIEMTARALGELDKNPAQPSANGHSASILEVEFEQVRELGRVIRDSSSHDAERWANPADAAQLKQLINAEFVSDKLVPTDNTGQLRLAALAATVLLMFGIGYVLVRTPPESVSGVAKLDDAWSPGTVVNADAGIEQSPEANLPELAEALDATTDAVSNIGGGRERLDRDAAETDLHITRGIPESRIEDAQDKLRTELAAPNKDLAEKEKQLVAARERKQAAKEIQSGTMVGDAAANPVSDSWFDQQKLANDPSLRPGMVSPATNPPAEPGVSADEFQLSGQRQVRRGGGTDAGERLQRNESGEDNGFVLKDETAIVSDGASKSTIDLAQDPAAHAPGPVYRMEAGPDSGDGKNGTGIQFDFDSGVSRDSETNESVAIVESGTRVPSPHTAGNPITSPVDSPDGGTVLLGGIKSTADGRMNDAYLATPDLKIPFSQNSFGAQPPHFGGFGEGGGGGEYGFRPDIDRFERPSNEQYELPPENPFLKPVLERALSTFSIDVDTASYANIRRFITSGQLPPGNAVRIEEMVNYFSYAYPQPVDGKPFSVSLDVAQCPWQRANKLVRVGIQGRDIPRDDRPASNLVFLIDVSGSMSDQNKLPLLQRSMLMLVDQLTENDRVSIVTYASNAGVRLQPTSGDQKQIIRDVINSLSSGGSTHGSAGITTAYELATQHFIEGGTNRVILATDGDLNVGVTDDDSLVQLIKSKAESGVFLSVLGFGTGNLKDGKLEKIADNGNGQYCYIDSIREAQKVLVAEMSGSLVTIAKDVKLQIEFNPAEVASYRLIGYENRALENEDFANDRVDAGDIGAGHSVTAFYEIVPVRTVNKPAPAPPSGLRYQNAQAVVVEQGPSVDEDTLTDAARTGELMYVALRFKQPESSESDLLEVTVKDSNQSFDAAPADFRFAASVAAYGMKLRQSSYAGNWTWSDIENIAVSTIGDDPHGHRAELVDLLRQTRRLLGR